MENERLKDEIKELKVALDAAAAQQLEVKEKEKVESGKKWQRWKQCYVCLEMTHTGICEVCL